jgi:glycosyltransferase involved in cell wall biosynthesis
MSQRFKNFTCYITDDMSTDNTVSIIKETIKGDDRFVLIENTKKMYQPGNYDQVIRGLNIPDDEVCVEVDGDDWLPNSNVLGFIDDVYKNPDIWMTSGSFKYHDGRPGFAKKPHNLLDIRKQTFTLTHLRTWKSWLWKKIEQSDLMDSNGEYWSVAGDLSFMFPMVEMSGEKHFKFIPEILYVYNESNPLNDHKVNMSVVNNTTSIIRNKKPYKRLSGSESTNPHDLITNQRFDVIVKYLYAQSIIKNYQTDTYKNLYKEHLIKWNNCFEISNPSKNSFEVFDNTFKDIITNISENGFDPQISKIPVVNDKYIVNGAHRLAASLALNKNVFTEESTSIKDGQLICSWEGEFKKLNLSETLCDRVALEYAKLKNNTYIVSVFPSTGGNIEVPLSILKKYGSVFYYKQIKLEKNGPLNFMRELYAGEQWAGNHQNNYIGYRQKEGLCFTQNAPVTIFLVEFDSVEQSVRAKEEIRNRFNIGKHSVHINDTHDQTIRLSQCVFNQNSIKFMCDSTPSDYRKFDGLLNSFKKYIEDNNLDIDEYAVTASSILSIYGLREGKDLDYIHTKLAPLIKLSDDIQSHNSYGIGRYELNYDEIIHNPVNHFYSRGVKFVSPKIIKDMKKKRNEPKDINDINLLNSIL